ncbi:MAG: type IX secretion system sortase PorU [Flavobacteriales bacterium]
MKYAFAVALVLLACFPALAQQSSSFDVHPAWMDANLSGHPWFDNAILDGEVPQTVITEPISPRYRSAVASLEVLETAPLTPAEAVLVDVQALPAEFGFTYKVKRAREQRFFTAEVGTLRRNPQTGTVEKLVDANITAVYNTTAPRTSRSWRMSNTSQLAEGTWYKIAIARDGVYRMDRSFLEDLGVDVDAINPQNINLYGNGGEQLPYENSEFRYDDLERNAIFISGEADGSFDPQDFILFYGKGSDSWEFDDDDPFGARFEHHKHHFSDSAYYFMRVDDVTQERVSDLPQTSGAVTVELASFADYQFAETDNVNLIKSGREFLGEVFDNTPTFNFNFAFPNIDTDSPGHLSYRIGAASVGSSSSFNVNCGDFSTNATVNQIGTTATSSAVRMVENVGTFTPTQQNVTATFTYNASNATATGYMDYVAIGVRRALTMTGNQMHFRDTTGVGAGAVAEWQLDITSASIEVWDVTDVTEARRVQFDNDGDEITFRQSHDQVREYVAFLNAGYLTPRAVGPVANQNLHGWSGVDMVIVSSPLLITYAEELAEIHREEGLTVEVTTPMLVYNEFSSGNPDVTAIKMLMKHLYDDAGGNEDLMPRYLCIFGDGSYRGNKGVNAINSYNVITYHNFNHWSPTASYVSDDYFAFLDDDESEASSDMLDVGVGRIPASNAEYAANYMNKLRLYLSDNPSEDGGAYCLGDAALSPYGSWRNVVAFIADDQDGNGNPTEDEHMKHSDEYADSIFTKYNDYDVVKLYMDAYQQESTPGGERYPEGSEAIRRRVENGALIVNYVGHGGEKGFAHERILDISTIKGWENINRLPVFMTATCELSRFDDPDFESAGELIVMNPNGGGIAMLTTTRIVFSGSNHDLAEQFYRVALADSANPELRLGDIARFTKNEGPNSSNTRNFSLLGDPAVAMAYPEKKVFTTHINGEALTADMDTIRSLETVTVRGFVGDDQGNVLTGFNGFVYPSVYDKRDVIQVFNNDGGAEYDFPMFQSLIYKGKASVENGEFEFTFAVPRDINYTFGTGRISYYAVAGSEDGHGHFEDFIIGGSPDGGDVVLNDVGPEIELFMNDSTFVFGGLTDEEPILFARLFDENGINTVGNGIGHDLKATLDNNTADQIILNDFYEADLNTFQSGEIRYQLTGLDEGRHTLALKVWDIHNNSSEAYTEFVVAPTAEVALDHVLNYPNPFTTRTEFMFEHNQACDFLEVKIEVFTVSGKLVKTLRETVYSAGFRADPVAWDGKDEYGDKIGRGVYVYRVHVRTPDGRTAEQLEKLVVLN